MTIGELVQRKSRPKPKPAPEPSDLLNDDYPCECGVCGCNSPLLVPRSQR